MDSSKAVLTRYLYGVIWKAKHPQPFAIEAGFARLQIALPDPHRATRLRHLKTAFPVMQRVFGAMQPGDVEHQSALQGAVFRPRIHSDPAATKFVRQPRACGIHSCCIHNCCIHN